MTNSASIQTYLADIVRIVEGAANLDGEKVAAYAAQLCDRLEGSGETEAAKRLRKVLAKGSVSRSSATPARLNGAAPLPVESEFRLPMADEHSFQPGEVPVYLSTQAQDKVADFLAFYRAAGKLASHGVPVGSSLLLYGPPGCGKTQVAGYISSELQLPLITARADGVISSYLGSTAKNLRLLFDHFMSRPSILFLDEFDAVAKMRDDSQELGELKRVVISLLQNIDALDHDHVLIAATNHDHLLDPAIWRRFTYKIHLATPDEAARRAMLQSFLRDFATDTLVDIGTALGDGLSGAQLRRAAEHCIRLAVLKDDVLLNPEVWISTLIEARSHKGEQMELMRGDRSFSVRALRDADPKRFTQKKLAEIFGVSQATVNRMLHDGSQDPSFNDEEGEGRDK